MQPEIPVWLDRALQSLQAMVADGRPPTGLFIGAPTDLGQRWLALAFARHLLGLDPAPTGLASTPSAGAAIAHPDFREVGLEDRTVITVDAIRSIGEYAQQTARGAIKVILIDPGDRMNRNAANALLKTLEEPAPGTVLLLTGYGRPLLPTLLSRCQQVRLRVTDEEVDAWLAVQGCEISAERRAVGRALFRQRPLDQLALDDAGWSAMEARLEHLAACLGPDGIDDALLALADTQDAAGLLRLLWLLLALAVRTRALGAGHGATSWPACLHAPVTALATHSPEWLYARLDATGIALARLAGTTNPNPRLLLESLLIDWLDPPPRRGWPERTGGFNIA